MARMNKREEVLEAIARIIERDGLTTVTLDAVAAATGMTRAGLLYHFPSREALIQATHEHLTELWEKSLIASAGKPSSEASDNERHSAYISVCTKAARRVELLLMLGSSDSRELGQLWQQVIDRWAPAAPQSDDAQDLDKFIARLAADGLWIHEALSTNSINTDLRKRVIDRLTQLVNGDLA
ncbi:TetR family transcriptional regulator [Vibrio cholerae]|nr:TetR family transcriptional regulator [Vibrio cholerae]